VTIEVAGKRIIAVANGVASAPPGAHRLAGLTVPGMANAHSHAFHRALRGRTHGETGSFWTWRDRMYQLADRLDPDTYRSLATATFGEMVLAGFTCVGEFHYLHHDRKGKPYAEPNAMGQAIIDAAGAAGIRLTLLDTCYLQSGMGAAGERSELRPAQRRFSDGDAAAWATRVERLTTSETTAIGAAIHSVRSIDPDAMPVVTGWAASRSAPLHAHVSEQPSENDQCRAAFGCTPTELLARHDVLGQHFTAVHATHLSDGDVASLASSGSMCCLCPTTERDLADGIGPSAALRAANVSMCIGTDSHAVIDPLEEARAVELDERLSSLQRGTHRPGELLAMASSAGYRSLGWPDGGRIEADALADFTTVSLDSPRLAGTDAETVVASVLFAGTAHDVSHVVVGGRIVVADGAHRTVDVTAELQRSIARVWA
jgi:formiminoglutamate deiminase